MLFEEKINYNSEDLKNHKAIAAVIWNDDKTKVLVQKHNKFGFWTIPVGKVESNESVQQGLKKELFEECNIKVLKSKLLKTKDFVYNRQGKNVNVKSFLYEILKYTGEIKNKEPSKHEQQIFMSIEELREKDYLSNMTQLFLQMFKK
jgi:ADP-ribose pyrophosphatase YjhB (NUDIX family)